MTSLIGITIMEPIGIRMLYIATSEWSVYTETTTIQQSYKCSQDAMANQCTHHLAT